MGTHPSDLEVICGGNHSYFVCDSVLTETAMHIYLACVHCGAPRELRFPITGEVVATTKSDLVRLNSDTIN